MVRSNRSDVFWLSKKDSLSVSSLYLHIPFCRRRCRYCDFFSTTAGPVERNTYVDLLCRHLELIGRNATSNTALQTIYFGGGTPSLLTGEQLTLVLKACRDRFGLSAAAEITLEVNPGTFGGEYLQQVRQAGVNRLSIGIQSFDGRQLQQLGRCHDVDQARAAVTAARAAGFDNISLDLMFALPGQSSDDLNQEIDLLLQQEPEHISVYGLTIEEGTEFERWRQQGKLEVTDEDEYARQYELLRARFTAAGYEHYELSNFALPGRCCRHNQRYWQRRSCLAVGCGAHSFVEQGYGERWHVPTDLARYRRLLEAGADPAELLEDFDRRGAMAETVYLALRTSAGIDLAAFEQCFAEPLQRAFPAALAQLQGSLVWTRERVILPPNHWLIYDHLIASFF
jgi:oxygen-independent coproporphyrinogen III oxidase